MFRAETPHLLRDIPLLISKTNRLDRYRVDIDPMSMTSDLYRRNIDPSSLATWATSGPQLSYITCDGPVYQERMDK